MTTFVPTFVTPGKSMSWLDLQPRSGNSSVPEATVARATGTGLPQLFSKLTECDSYCRANRQAWAVDESHRSLRSGIISIPAPILST